MMRGHKAFHEQLNVHGRRESLLLSKPVGGRLVVRFVSPRGGVTQPAASAVGNSPKEVSMERRKFFEKLGLGSAAAAAAVSAPLVARSLAASPRRLKADEERSGSTITGL
jgi:hypothetical protein